MDIHREVTQDELAGAHSAIGILKSAGVTYEAAVRMIVNVQGKSYMEARAQLDFALAIVGDELKHEPAAPPTEAVKQ